MPIIGSVAIATVAAPAASSPTPYTVYTVTNPTGLALYGFTITNLANVPVSLTIFQDTYNNPIMSTTLLASQAATQFVLQGNLVAGEKILATASQGGVVQIEIDGILNVADPAIQMMLALILMWSTELGTPIPSQAMLNAGGYSFT